MSASLEKQAETTLQSLKYYEQFNFIAKLIFYILATATIIVVQIFTYHALLKNSDNNHQLLRCTITELTNPNDNPQNFRTSLQTCLDNTK